MKTEKVFQEFVEEQLDGITGLRFRRMFGGYGIYADEVFFDIVHGERLYFRTNERTRERYEKAGMSWFVTPGGKKSVKAYYEVPAAVIERAKDLRQWARESVEATE